MQRFYVLPLLIVGAFLGCSVQAQPQSYNECTEFPGSRILKTYPAQCVSSTGQVFVDSSAKPLAEVPLVKPACVNKCGDGVCQEIVCMATNCPCAESAETCPKDCGEGTH